MKKIVIIDHCYACPHCVSEHDSPIWDVYCMNAKREYEDNCTIPSWCPLDNA